MGDGRRLPLRPGADQACRCRSRRRARVGGLDRRGFGLHGHGHLPARPSGAHPAGMLVTCCTMPSTAQHRQFDDTVVMNGAEWRVLNVEATEAAKEKLLKIKTAFDRNGSGPIPIAPTGWLASTTTSSTTWCRGISMAATFTLPNASNIIRFYDHQKRVIWRIISAGSTYIAHAVGAGKTFSMAAAVMEQKRLGLISKAMLVVPGHCLAQASREFLQLYPTARILVADETNFVKEKRARFLARAATATWDAIIITHSAFRFIAVPSTFEQRLIEDQIAMHEAVNVRADTDDRTTRKRIEAIKEKLDERLQALKTRRDDMLTIEEIGVDQLIVDEAQEFRKLSFATNRVNLKGVDPDGSQRAWDLFVKSRSSIASGPGRALIQSSGTPITNYLQQILMSSCRAKARLCKHKAEILLRIIRGIPASNELEELPCHQGRLLR